MQCVVGCDYIDIYRLVYVCVNMFEDTNIPFISYAKTLLREKIVEC